MTQLTILHHGAPLGTAYTAPELDAEPGQWFALNMMDFTPAPAYESVRSLAQHAAASYFGWFTGPLVDLEAADAAVPAAERLWAELELADVRGNPVAGRVVWLIEEAIGGKPSYWVDVELDDASADVPARRRPQPPQTSEHKSLPPNVP